VTFAARVRLVDWVGLCVRHKRTTTELAGRVLDIGARMAVAA